MKATPGQKGFHLAESTVFERSSPGRAGFSVGRGDVPEADPASLIPAGYLGGAVKGLPELTEPDVVRHFTRLSQWNYGVDGGMYPLGSCTMKYNPKFNEVAAAMQGFASAHPYLPEEMCQGSLELMWRIERALAEIAGMDAVTLQPSAGAHGEFCGLKLVRACLEKRGDPRKKVLIPDTAHGTNPASTTLNGYEAVEVKSGGKGVIEPATVAAAMDERVAAVMVTNPNTLGLFEENIAEIAEVVHSKGGLLYCDGANLNAVLGKTRPGDWGVDVLQFNLHKTFSTPHGGGGPGSGPVGVKKVLDPFLPVPVVVKDGERFRFDYERPSSIGSVRAFYGNFGVMVRAFAYIAELGPAGMRRVAEMAVLSANYLRASLKGTYDLPYDRICMHECIFSDGLQKDAGVTTMDVAKRLMDKGFHPPTVYFPLVVPGAIMIEPTETESIETLDAFIAAMKEIAEEAKTAPDLVKSAPHLTALSRLDEVRAARSPELRFCK